MNMAIGLSLIILLAFGVPVAVSIALASMFGIHFFSHFPLIVAAQRMFVGLDQYPLMAIPLFILAGNIMAAGGISARLVDFAKSIIGGIQGGLACSCVLTCMIFASVSGSSVATTFAIGSILIPAMVAHQYPKPLAASIQASSSELGVLIPPSIPLILYGVVTETSIGQLFIAGIGPGLLFGTAMILYLYVMCKITGYGLHDGQDCLGFWEAFGRAWASLLMPFIVIGGIYTGVFTATEASAVAVFYALFVGGVLHRELSLKALFHIFENSVKATAAILLIISAAMLFSFLINRSGLPSDIAAWVTATFDSKYSFLIAVNVLLLIMGMFIETGAALLILAPILAPIAFAFGVDPVHFGLIMIVNLAIGMFTPPLGVNLFAACAVAKISMERMIPYLIQFVIVAVVCLALVTFFPVISIGLRDLLY
ncbi:MAG: TRAP transporter large permease [Ectothiorhodospiraceae bacterium]|nr:TRAP transporter large permease [Ectothiorhodospiraceae bacterium]MCH8503442.1 TRAP transporter large permease [Ectothiorhodospiraceae bacterium]